MGLMKWDGLAPGDAESVRTAADVLAHRGPDSAGAYADSHIALGFRRLKVIDLSPAGEQPMGNEDGSLHVVFNGEIYNYRELREELRGQGHTFKSQSDTEVLLHLYEQHGEEMLPKLRGMFAFALWDAKARRLLMVRDPVGVKPLYFAERPGLIACASEPKALFALGIKPEIDPVAIDEALAYRYVPAPRSGFRDVEKLPPGHVAVAEQGALVYRRWWDLKTHKPLDAVECVEMLEAYSDAALPPYSPETAHHAVTPLVRMGAARRLESDVPLGVWLSGGIDSGLVLSQMGKNVKSFCAGFAQSEYDERVLARATAGHLGSAHTEFEVPADVFRLLPQIVWHADEPFFDSSCLPTFVLAEKTKAHATVVLSGDGGDEAFAGYDRYVGMQLLRTYKRTPAFLRALALAFARWRHPAPSRQGWDRMLRWLEKCRLMEESGHHPYVAAMELFSAEQRAAMYGAAMEEAVEGCDARECLEGALRRAREESGDKSPHFTTAPGVLQRADLETYLPGDVLHKVDRMSMAHGLEVRSPFLDVGLLSFALSLPDEVRLPGRQTKPLLRQAAAKVLPAEVAQARKRGFGVPLDEWFRGPLRERTLSLLEDSHLVGDKLFKPRFWERMWQQHQRREAQHGERLYAMVSLELWYRMFIAGPMPVKRPEPL
ncbi:MAG: asparagine synthase (glutamine-hydrolyzing) [Planctomycetota bacterium]|nr:asparagine synthase (glutamine-hydrolyzing) [Planctomycetota bacterium]